MGGPHTIPCCLYIYSAMRRFFSLNYLYGPRCQQKIPWYRMQEPNAQQDPVLCQTVQQAINMGDGEQPFPMHEGGSGRWGGGRGRNNLGESEQPASAK